MPRDQGLRAEVDTDGTQLFCSASRRLALAARRSPSESPCFFPRATASSLCEGNVGVWANDTAAFTMSALLTSATVHEAKACMGGVGGDKPGRSARTSPTAKRPVSCSGSANCIGSR